jgi:hypothetical protein
VTGQTPAVTLCYEAGYDGFWLARFFEQHGIECLVMEPVSLQFNRWARRVAKPRRQQLNQSISGACETGSNILSTSSQNRHSS